MVKVRLTEFRHKSSHRLGKVKQLAAQNRVEILQRALATAWDDFGWMSTDIKAALRRLRVEHFRKTEPCIYGEGLMIDVYEAVALMDGRDVYTKFYVELRDRDGEVLVIQSFKKAGPR